MWRLPLLIDSPSLAALSASRPVGINKPWTAPPTPPLPRPSPDPNQNTKRSKTASFRTANQSRASPSSSALEAATPRLTPLAKASASARPRSRLATDHHHHQGPPPLPPPPPTTAIVESHTKPPAAAAAATQHQGHMQLPRRQRRVLAVEVAVAVGGSLVPAVALRRSGSPRARGVFLAGVRRRGTARGKWSDKGAGS